jgi:hypothetical protein
VTASPNVLITEGEHDADTVNKLLPSIGLAGTLVATTTPNGASDVKPEYLRPLHGKETVYVSGDNDKAGHMYAWMCGKELSGKVGNVRMLKVPDGYKDWTEWVEGGGTAAQFGALLGDARPWSMDDYGSDSPEQTEIEGRIELNARAGDLDRLSNEAWAALETQNEPPFLFRFGDVVCRRERNDCGVLIVRELMVDRLRYELARLIKWYKIIQGSREDAPPPVLVCRNMLAHPQPPLPALKGIVTAPTFVGDGSLIKSPGYHAAWGLYMDLPAGLTIPDIPPRPTAEDIIRSRTLICQEWLGDFPFTGPAELAAAMALCLLPFVREMITGPTPLYLVEKPSPGTGAGLLVSVLTSLFLGREVAAMPDCRDEEEWRKRITATLVESPSFVLIDNLGQRLDSSALSSVLTTTVWRDRRLGHTETIHVPVRCAWVATGNNPALSNEMSRRTIRMRLDARMDRPWLKNGFKHPDLKDWTAAHRGELIAAVLTLVQAWVVAGRPPGAVKLGSFESWSQVLGGILSHAGVPGFLENLHELYDQSDEEGAAWRVVLEAWWAHFQDGPVGVSNVYGMLACEDPSLDLGLGDGNPASQKIRLGKRLAQMRDRQFGRWQIVHAGMKQRAVQWRLVEVSPVEGRPTSVEMEEIDLAN